MDINNRMYGIYYYCINSFHRKLLLFAVFTDKYTETQSKYFATKAKEPTKHVCNILFTIFWPTLLQFYPRDLSITEHVGLNYILLFRFFLLKPISS